MDLELSPQHLTFRDAVREIAQGVVRPLAEEVDREHRFPVEAIEAATESGLMGVLIPREYGGAGLDALAFAICIEELAQACASTAVIIDVHTSVGTEPSSPAARSSPRTPCRRVSSCESSPPIPFDGDRPDMENIDHAQAVAIAALMEVGESVGEGFDWRLLVKD